MSNGNAIHHRCELQRDGRWTDRPGQLTAAALALLLSGCVTDAQFLAQNSPAALSAVENRGKFELNCPQVQSSVLSQKVTQSLQGYSGWGMAGAPIGPWTEYTVGVRGCGRQAVYMAVCRDESNCNAFSQTARTQNAPQ